MSESFETIVRNVVATALKKLPTEPEAMIIAIAGADGVRLTGFADSDDNLNVIMAICRQILDDKTEPACPHCFAIEAACGTIVEIVKRLSVVLDALPHSDKMVH